MSEDVWLVMLRAIDVKKECSTSQGRFHQFCTATFSAGEQKCHVSYSCRSER